MQIPQFDLRSDFNLITTHYQDDFWIKGTRTTSILLFGVMAIQTEGQSDNEVEISILRVCIMGDSRQRIARKTGLSQNRVNEGLDRLVKAKMLSFERGTGYFFVTSKGEHFLSSSNPLKS